MEADASERLRPGIARIQAWAIAALILAAGPALQVYAASDLLGWRLTIVSPVHLLPHGFFAATLWSYGLATRVPDGIEAWLQVMLASIAGFIVFAACTFVTALLMFGASGRQSELAMGFILPISAVLSSATFAKLAPRIGSKWRDILVLTGVMIIAAWMQSIMPHGPRQSWQSLIGAWPVLLALLPAAVVLWWTPPRAAPSAVLAIILALTPMFVFGAWMEHRTERGLPIAWPVRLWSEFVGEPERSRLVQQYSSVTRGKPVRIGAHWYLFPRHGFANTHAHDAVRPDRIGFIQIDVPAADLALPPSRNTERAEMIQLDIGAPHPRVVRDRRADRDLSDSLYVGVAFEDLQIRIVRNKTDPRGWPDDAIIKERLLAYMASIRVPPPAGSAP